MQNANVNKEQIINMQRNAKCKMQMSIKNKYGNVKCVKWDLTGGSLEIAAASLSSAAAASSGHSLPSVFPLSRPSLPPPTPPTHSTTRRNQNWNWNWNWKRKC